MHKVEETFQTHLQRRSPQNAPTILNEMWNVSDNKATCHPFPIIWTDLTWSSFALGWIPHSATFKLSSSVLKLPSSVLVTLSSVLLLISNLVRVGYFAEIAMNWMDVYNKRVVVGGRQC